MVVGLNNDQPIFDMDIINRIIVNYGKHYNNTELSNAPIWEGINKIRNNFHEALISDYKKGTQNQTAEYFFHAVEKNLFYGYEIHQKTGEYGSQWEAPSLEYDALFMLAQALGAEKMVNPEQGIRETYPEVETLLSELDTYFGNHIDFPSIYNGLIGVKSTRGIVTLRELHSLYYTKLLLDFSAKRVLEIGAGMGYTAYYMYKLGSVQNYSIVDIPLTGVTSFHFLATTTNKNEVSLFAEDLPNSKINIYTPELFPEDVTFDVVLNTDSLTEMSEETAKNYINKIKKITKVFISINHEVNPFTVRQLLQNDPDVKSYTRNPFWLRRGYVEEVFTF